MKYCYVPKKFSPEHLFVISKADAYLNSCAEQNITITLRSLYYHFVAADLFPGNRKWAWTGSKWVKSPKGSKNAQPNYDWLKGIIGDARLAGYIDWTHLEDMTRYLAALESFDNPQTALNDLANRYRLDMWASQSHRPEVWIEKDALVGVIRAVCEENDVPYFSCRGYTSLSEIWRASLRLRNYHDNGYTPVILHFGDHDPSGVDMSRDIEERLKQTFMADCEFKRLALTLTQIEEYNPPPNPVKETDSRWKAYVERFDTEDCWELDSLQPTKFRGLIEEVLSGIRNQDQWDVDLALREDGATKLREVSQEWESLGSNKKLLVKAEKDLNKFKEQVADLTKRLAHASISKAPYPKKPAAKKKPKDKPDA